MQLVDLNTDVLLDIVDAIDSPTSLLALGLTCRTLYACTIPFPLHYRQLSWPTQNANGERIVASGQWLASVPKQGKAVREVRVGGRLARRTPAFLSEAWSRARFNAEGAPTDAMILSELAMALEHMPNLTSFVYDWHPPPPTSLLWPALLQVQNLQSLSFRLESHSSSTSCPTLEALLPILRASSPSLRSLTLSPSFPSKPYNITPLLTMHFPNLQILSLTSALAPPLPLSTFLSFHPTINSLRLRCPGLDLSLLPPTCLPHLSSLDVSTGPVLPTRGHRPTTWEFGQPFLRPLPAGAGVRPIRNLKLTALDREQVVEFLGLLPNLPHLERIRPGPTPRKKGTDAGERGVHPALWADWRFLKWARKRSAASGDGVKAGLKMRLRRSLSAWLENIHEQ